MGNVERRLDRTEPRGEIAIEHIAAVTSAEDGFDQRLIRVKERGVRLEKQPKAHTQQNFDSLMGRYDERFEQIDKRFAQVCGRFEQVEQRFEQVDKRLEPIDQRITGSDSKLDRFHGSVLAGLGVIVVQSLVMNFL